MPHFPASLFSAFHHDSEGLEEGQTGHMWGRAFQKLHWRKKDDEETQDEARQHDQEQLNAALHSISNAENERPSWDQRRPPRSVVPGLPRPITFRRQNSEKRDRLVPDEPSLAERRAVSVDRRPRASTGVRHASTPNASRPSFSAPNVRSLFLEDASRTSRDFDRDTRYIDGRGNSDFFEEGYASLPPGQPPPLSTTGPLTDRDDLSEGIDDIALRQELESKWILNLSMHFRDMSDREKFFLAYAEEHNRWRRVTVSLDYRNAPSDSLEADLKSLHYQRDKSARIYESIRDSLPSIQFYDTVTNLKLQTGDGQLHVHVTEDVNEIIPYPPTSAIGHLTCNKFFENSISFDSHISGFVYKVRSDGQVYIKKEIPGPDAVEEFLYEINALSSLHTSQNVITFEGVILDDKGELIKGLLISYAEQGALVDILYDMRGTPALPWPRRERWAKQIVRGLSEIHEAGFVQGDFTLSNIVIDAHDNAKIIDINRRGCPVGWEPPELARLIESGQRISIYIGVKSDLFQMGMVLWALAEEKDEPEREERPLPPVSSGMPHYFSEVVASCLSSDPSERLSAKDLLAKFPELSQDHAMPLLETGASLSSHRSEKEYIDPATAVGLEDIDLARRQRLLAARSERSAGDHSFTNVDPSTEYQFESSGSFIVPRPRGRSPGGANSRRPFLDSPYVRPVAGVTPEMSDISNEELLPPPPPVEEYHDRWEQGHDSGITSSMQRISHDTLEAEPASESAYATPLEDHQSPHGEEQTPDYVSRPATVANIGPFAHPVHHDSGFADGTADSPSAAKLEAMKDEVEHFQARGHWALPFVTPTEVRRDMALQREECGAVTASMFPFEQQQQPRADRS